MRPQRRILIVDDHPLFREGLKSLLVGRSDYRVIAEAGTAKEAKCRMEELHPDLVMMDLALPDASGIDITRTICEAWPGTHVVVVSMHITTDYITRALQAGARGYFVKESATEKLLECLDTISNGNYYLDSALSDQIALRLIGTDKGKAENVAAAYDALTPREQEVMRLIAEGLPSKRIADKLSISHKTVENHRTNIMSKLNLHSAMELVRYAARYGIIDLKDWTEPGGSS